MVVVRLQGGLGNQMFQYAAGRSILKKRNRVYLDLDFFKNSISHETFTARQFNLDIFKKLKGKKAYGLQIKFFKSNNLLFRLIRRTLKNSIKYLLQNENEYTGFKNFSQCRYIYLDGYFQSEKYFKNVRSELLKEFSFPALDDTNEQVRNEIEKMRTR